jgi:hypothetical protein
LIKIAKDLSYQTEKNTPCPPPLNDPCRMVALYKRNKGCHTVALPFTLKIILRQKKNYENSNISPCKNISSKNPLKEAKTLQDIITL